MTVRVEDGVATEVEPNFDSAQIHPAAGRVCVKAYGLIQKAYNPHRILTPMKRTNAKKGRDQDPGFVAISWDEALDSIAGRLKEIRQDGVRDSSGFPRLAASFGGGGTPTAYMGAFPAFLSAWGPVDLSFGSGQGVKCTHSEHLYGELWHRAFTVAPDTPLSEYLIYFGANTEASGGVCGVSRHAKARSRGTKRVQIEPHLSITGACSEEWVPIKPKTDSAFMFAMIHVLLHEKERDRLDLPFLTRRTTSPYLVGPEGYFLRHPASRKPLVWDTVTATAVPFDTAGAEPALEGTFEMPEAFELGADGEEWPRQGQQGRTSFSLLVDHVKDNTPEWAAQICDVPVETIRRITGEYLDHARVGETIEIEGRILPFRPVAIMLGKTVNNGWGGFDCCWARTLMACLIGGLEVPGGTLGTTVRLNRPATSRQASVKGNLDGIMDFPMNPTDKDNWVSRPKTRNAYSTLVPLVANSPWSQALGPTQLAWMMQMGENGAGLEHLPKPTRPDIWFVYRTNPVISYWDTEKISGVLEHFPMTVCFAYTRDETNHMADILLPDCMDLESLQLLRIGGTKYIEQFWKYQGFALRQPAIEAPGETRDMTWIASELAKRSGLLQGFNEALNKGAAGIPLRTDDYDFSLSPDSAHSVEEIWHASCRAASHELTDGEDSQGLDYYKEHGFRVKPFAHLNWYLYPTFEDQDLRFEMPYQERLTRHGKELANRLHEAGINWWDRQLEEYEPLPVLGDYPALWERALEDNFDVDIKDFPFWLITSRSMQYSWGNNAGLQVIRELAKNVAGHGGVVMNAGRATELGLADGDLVEVASPLAATRGRVILRQGIRPDTLLMIGQFDHWATPLAKTFEAPSMNKLVPMLMDLTDSTGSGSDLVKVSITRLDGAP